MVFKSNLTQNGGMVCPKAVLAEFQRAMGYEFPLALKNYYLTMNGLDTPGIDVQGSRGAPPRYGSIYYSYPDDLDQVKQTIDWVLNANHVAPEDLPKKASRIFPVRGHRFLLIDDPKIGCYQCMVMTLFTGVVV